MIVVLVIIAFATCNKRDLRDEIDRRTWFKKKECAKIGWEYAQRKESIATKNGNTVIEVEYAYNPLLDTCVCAYTLVVPGAYNGRFVDDALTGRALVYTATTDSSSDQLQFESDRRALLAGEKPDSPLIRRQRRF